jgi:hypothetical protein
MVTRSVQRLSYSKVVGVLAVLVALGAGALAVAAARPASTVVVHACYETRDGDARVVAPGTRCARSERALTFNLPGRPGSSGASGASGEPGVAGQFPQGTLPTGSTVRGHWAAGLAAPGSAYAAVSFLFAFAEPPAFHYVSASGSPPAGCTGGTNADPTAQPGNLCVYSSGSGVNTAGAVENLGASTDWGAVFSVSSAGGGAFSDGGAWAATSP